MKGRITGAIALTLAVSATVGCSTKNYGRQPELTSFEKQTLTCREIDLEQAKVQGFLAHVREESEFDGRSVLSFLGDFGIGNLMERDAAIDSASKRMTQLSEARLRQNCSYANRVDDQLSRPLASGSASTQHVGAVSAATKEQQLQELSSTPGLSYEEYQRRYQIIMAQ